MKQLHHIAFRLSTCMLLLASLSVQAQTKTYNETFKVTPETLLDITTSHADLEFETWDQQQVVVEATIELEGASKEEAEAYFKNNGISIMGNSEKIKITTGPGGHMNYSFSTGNAAKIAMEVRAPMEPLFMDLEIPDLPPMPEMPPMPPMPQEAFDYEAFKKDGEKYMKKWQKEFRKGFDAEYEKELEAWSEAMSDRMEVYAERNEMRTEMRERRAEEREERREEMEEAREEVRREMEEIRTERRRDMEEAREYARETARKAMDDAREVHKHVIIERQKDGDAPNIFYFSGEGANKNFKIKKTIKVKMPKSLKIKMNVKHGEVKLASQTNNLDANLSYASLKAKTIDGSATKIYVAYSPVSIQLWKLGSLHSDFSGGIELNEVQDLDLKANSSEVSIVRLMKRANIENSLGSLSISSIGDNFQKIDVRLQNAEFQCALPDVAYSFTLEGRSNDLNLPGFVTKSEDVRGGFERYNGVHLNKNTGKTFVVHANYSNIQLQQ